MSEDQTPAAVSESIFTIFGVTLRCYVLDNGQRVINGEDMERLFAHMTSDAELLDNDPEMVSFQAWREGRE